VKVTNLLTIQAMSSRCDACLSDCLYGFTLNLVKTPIFVVKKGLDSLEDSIVLFANLSLHKILGYDKGYLNDKVAREIISSVRWTEDEQREDLVAKAEVVLKERNNDGRTKYFMEMYLFEGTPCSSMFPDKGESCYICMLEEKDTPEALMKQAFHSVPRGG